GGNPGKGFGNTYSYTIAGNYLLAPHMILDAHFGWTRMDSNVEQPGLDQNIGRDVLGIPGTNGTRRFEGGWPRFQITGFATLGMTEGYMPYYRSDPQYQYVANLGWTKGFPQHPLGDGPIPAAPEPHAAGALYGDAASFRWILVQS